MLPRQFRRCGPQALGNRQTAHSRIDEDTLTSDNIFIYIFAHPNREEAKKNWAAMRADPAFQEMVKSEQTGKLVEKVDSTYMRPTDFSPLK